MKLKKTMENVFKRELSILWVFAVLSSLALIVLQNKNKLPLGKGDFVFLAIIALLVALWKPRWIFFLFVSFVPLENIILASGFLPVQLRPYQFLGTVLIIAIAILFIFKKLRFKILKPAWIDWLLFSLAPFSFLALTNSPNKAVSIKQNFVLLSFIALYWLIRNFIRNKDDLIKITFFFLGSFFVVTTYGFYQIFADKFGAQSFEVMFGRPNSTFAEPDWLGIYLCFALAASLAITNIWKSGFQIGLRIQKISIYLLIFLDLLLLVLTLSRSAWIGAATIVILYLLYNLYRKEKEGIVLSPKKFARELTIISLILFISLAIIRFGKLSKFDIFDRARSAATSEQKITIACENNLNIPQIVSDTAELAKYNCQHINLEEIDYYKSRGKIVAETYRQDPNVFTRGQVYQKSWKTLREHPLLGVGFGTITQELGADERGAGLNESNILLQIWAGSGIFGLIAFIAAISYLFMHSFRKLSPVCPLQKWLGCPIVKDDFEKALAVFAVLGILALAIPNLFNAGLFMGIFWLGLPVIVSFQKLNP